MCAAARLRQAMNIMQRKAPAAGCTVMQQAHHICHLHVIFVLQCHQLKGYHCSACRRLPWHLALVAPMHGAHVHAAHACRIAAFSATFRLHI